MFENLRETKKGSIGEQIIKDYLINNGYNVAQFHGNSPHLVDFIAHKSGNKQRLFAFEVKTKPIVPPYTSTGFNKSHYDDYMQLYKGPFGLDTFVFFVDEIEEAVYGNYISKLQSFGKRTITDKRTNKEIYVWDRKCMQTICKLTKTQINEIKQYSK
jgi:hypothetical protein